ncbi:MAG: hypothetical protein JNK72_07050 [Myxococcales bacterium]|nr:hypothetical protein [Myxococcales bacterium]
MSLARALTVGLLLTACQPAAAPPSTVGPATLPATPLPGPERTADRRHFAATLRYQGECMPAGSRGGCYLFEFEPNGDASHVLLDARLGGTYRLDGDTVIFESTAPDSTPSRLTLVDQGRALSNGYRLVETPR